MRMTTKNQFWKRELWGVSLGAVLLVLSGCGLDNSTSPSPAELHEGLVQVEVDEIHGFVYHDRVFWVESSLFEEGLVSKEPGGFVVTAELKAAFRELLPGDVLISDYQLGFWQVVRSLREEGDHLVVNSRDARIEEVIKDGEVVLSSPEGSATPPRSFQSRREYYRDGEIRETRQGQGLEEQFEQVNGGGSGGVGSINDPTVPVQPVSGLSIDQQAVGSLNLGLNLTSNRHFDSNRARTRVEVADGGIQFRPAFQFRVRVQNGVVVEESMRVSGHAWVDALWDVEAKGQDAFQQAFSVPNLGSEQFTLSESRLGIEVGLSATAVANRFNQQDSFTAEVVPSGGHSTVRFTFAGRTATYDGLQSTGGLIPLQGLRSWLNDTFGDRGLVASYNHSIFNFRGRLTVRVSSNNAVSFRIAGRDFEAKPEMRVRYQYTGSGQGTLRTGFVGDGMVEAGYQCNTSGCSALPLRGTQQPFSAFSVNFVRDGAPSVDFRAYLEPGVVFSEGISQYASVNPLTITNRSNSQIQAPNCPLTHVGVLTSETEFQGSNYRTTRRELFSVSNIAGNVPGCNAGAVDDVQRCLGDWDCEEGEMCAEPGNFCIPDGELKVYLSWERTGTNLDLYVETPEGKIISPRNRYEGMGSLVLASQGGTACDNCAGSCVGTWTTRCSDLSPSNNECPYGCALESGVGSIGGAFCTGNRVAQCSNVAPFPATQTGICPPGCSQVCTPGGSTGGNGGIGDHRDVIVSPFAQSPDPGMCSCTGEYFESCASLGEASCDASEGCQWTLALELGEDSCSGGVRTCEDLGRNDCQGMSSCEWLDSAIEFPPYVEIFVFDEIQKDQKFRIWVVNKTEGIDGDVNYGLIFDVYERENFVINGILEAPEMSRSIFYEYTVPDEDGRGPGDCIPQADSIICATNGLECGTHSGTYEDNCGEPRNGLQCGECPAVRCEDLSPIGDQCPGDCIYQTTNGGRCVGGIQAMPCSAGQCACGEETDSQLCSMHGKACGTVWLGDTCGTQREVNCGTCTGADESCTSQNTCCAPESDAVLCGPPQYNAQTGSMMRPSFFEWDFVLVEDPATGAFSNVPHPNNTSCTRDADCAVPCPGNDPNCKQLGNYACDTISNVCAQIQVTNFPCGEFTTTDSCGNARRVNCAINTCSTLNQTDVRIAGPFDSCIGTYQVSWAEQLGDITYSCGEVVGSTTCTDDGECGSGQVCACPPGQATCSNNKRCVRFPEGGICEQTTSNPSLNYLEPPPNANPPNTIPSSSTTRDCRDLDFNDPWICQDTPRCLNCNADGENCTPVNPACICEPGTRIGQSGESNLPNANCAWTNQCTNTGRMERDEYRYSCGTDENVDTALNIGACGFQKFLGQRDCERNTDGRVLSTTLACKDGDFCTREAVNVAQACNEAGVQCGPLTVEDNCGIEVEITCVCSGNDLCDVDQCVECINNTHCSGGDVCFENQCVECGNNSHCSGSDFCHQNQCVQCTNDNQCSGSDFCHQNQCVECTGDAQCPTGSSCLNNTCYVSGCTVDSDCSGLNICCPLVPGQPRVCASSQVECPLTQ